MSATISGQGNLKKMLQYGVKYLGGNFQVGKIKNMLNTESV
jgi:hypothetical protein